MGNDMSMTMLTIFQILGVSAAYLGVTLGLPWLLLRRKFGHMRTPARFMAYSIAGNFYCMNLVLLLQLLHLSNRATLVIGTLIPFFAAAAGKYRNSFLSALERRTDGIRIVLEGKMGAKTFMLRLGNRIGKLSSGWLGKWLAPRWMDALLTLGVAGLVLYMYGTNTVSIYGYCTSDMTVHNYWINSMTDNRIFVNGVYPFGFHCLIYYLHEVFAIPVYVLLRVFALVQVLMIHLVLLAFLKMVCKSKYTPYAGVVFYITSNIFYQYTYLRYFAPLPQEYGLIFILPSVWFAIAFLQEKEYLSKHSLILFTASISLTLAVHFYDTMIAGLFCAGIAVGFCFRCLRWRYLKWLLLAGATGVLIAVLPMAAAYATGTPLEGSLYWGMNMASSESEIDTEKERADAQKGEKAQDTEGKAGSEGKPLGIMDTVLGELRYYVTNDSITAAGFMLGSVGALFVLGLLWYILRRPDYGAVMVAVSVPMGILCLLQASIKLGLPQVMDVSRYSIYIGYGMAIVWSLCLDGVVYLLFLERRGINFGGLAALAAACSAVVMTGVRTPVRLSACETNGAIICLTNIMRENRDASWTICSANDERQMMGESGYHYEMIEFLRVLEEMDGDTSLTIPTDVVYFFVEKKPVYYQDIMSAIRPGWEVSPADARKPLSTEGGIEPYIKGERLVTMSHMYYWAQAFRELYPNEMEVYYESDEFICYRIRQDVYNLYNFAIDYGYNQ